MSHDLGDGESWDILEAWKCQSSDNDLSIDLFVWNVD